MFSIKGGVSLSNPTLFFEFGPVVQLNRTSDSGSESRGFESRRGHFFYR